MILSTSTGTFLRAAIVLMVAGGALQSGDARRFVTDKRVVASPVSPKKGIGAFQHPFVDEDLADLHLAWFYDWGPSLRGISPPKGAQFVPMIWGKQNLNAHDLAAAKSSGAGVLLGFNEPDGKDQANMTVDEALAAWPQLEATGLRLGSPAPGTGDDLRPDGWLARFMAEAQARGLRVDFMCVHPYQRSFDPAQAVQDLIQEVTAVHELYHRPIWVTEYAMVRWHGAQGETPDYAAQATFVTESAAALEKLSFVEKYAWYTTIPNQPTFSAFTADGKETPVGTALRNLR